MGFAAGLDLHAQLQGTPDRAEAAAAMFENWCIAHLRGDGKMPGPPLEYYSGFPGQALWVDRETKLALELTAQHCTVSDQLARMNSPDQDNLLLNVRAQIAHWGPALTEDPTIGQTLPGSRAWVSPHAMGDPLRWGIVFGSDQGEDALTYLSVRFPENPNP
jgi:hypothetical protein